MEQFRISTLTDQFPNQLAQDEGGKVILAGKGDTWHLERLVTIEGGDNRAIIAPNLGKLPALAGLAPIFKSGCEELTGEVRLLPGSTNSFPWRIDGVGGGATITARQANLPDDFHFPSKGKVYLVWEGSEVKWQFRGGSDVPRNAAWALEELEPVDTDAIEKVKITFLALARVPPERSLTRDDETGNAMLTIEGDDWFLKPVKPDGGSVEAKGIFLPNLGRLQAIAQLVPVFPDPPSCPKEAPELRGKLEIRAASGDGDEFPWVFEERLEGLTITVLESAIPPEINFPSSGRVYLVWGTEREARWQWSGGVVEQIPDNAFWAVTKQGKERCSEHPLHESV